MIFGKSGVGSFCLLVGLFGLSRRSSCFSESGESRTMCARLGHPCFAVWITSSTKLEVESGLSSITRPRVLDSLRAFRSSGSTPGVSKPCDLK